MENELTAEQMDQKIGCMKQCMSMCDDMLKMTECDPSANSGRVATIRSLIMDCRMYCDQELTAVMDACKKEESDAPTEGESPDAAA